jgi:hypothetical protein
MSKKIILLDASALKVSSCDFRFARILLDGWRTPVNYNDVEFGSAFHACAKETTLTSSIDDGKFAALHYFTKVKKVIKAKKEYLNAPFLEKVCEGWYRQMFVGDTWQPILNRKGKPIVEFRFHIPFYVSEHYEVLLVGTIDKIVRHQSAPLLAVGDYKTTSMWDIPEFFRAYELSCQLMFYSLALKKLIELAPPDSQLASFRGKDTYSFIDGIFLKGADKPVEFKRSEMFPMNDGVLLNFEVMLKQFVKNFVDRLEARHDMMQTGIINGSCETKFGKCFLFNYCACNNSKMKEAIKEKEIIEKKYNPAEFGELQPEI